MARIAFCQNVMVEFMGYMSMSAVLKAGGHAVEVFCDSGFSAKRFLAEVKAFEPDIVGFSVLTPARGWALDMARRVKEETDALTVLGNVDAMLNPEIIEEPGVDAVCRGEGEIPLKELANRLDAGTEYTDIPGFWFNTPAGTIKNDLPADVLDLDDLPFHDRAMYDKYPFFRHSKYLRIMNGRGCPFHCTFCYNAQIKRHFGGSSYVRKRTPELAIQEIEYHVAQRKVNFIFFVDEVFWVKTDWLYEFLDLYQERVGLPFCATYRHGAIQEEDVRRLTEAGARIMVMATETGDETQRREVMEKNVTNADYLKVAEWFHKYKLDFGSSAFFGLPGDTVEDHVARLEFYRKLRPTYLWTTFFAPYPGLPLTESPEVQAALSPDTEFSPTLHHHMDLRLPDKARLERLKKVYYLCMIAPLLSPMLVWLTRFNIPFLFDFLFMTHFSFYVFKFERVSFRQLLQHIKVFVLKPLLK